MPMLHQCGCLPLASDVRCMYATSYPQLIRDEDIDEFRAKVSALETPRASVQFEGELGRGQSGVVARATVPAPGSDRSARQRLPVAAKVATLPGGVKPGLDERSTIDTALLVEGLLLLGLKHPHVVGLVAIVVDTTPVMLCKSPALRHHVAIAGPRAVAQCLRLPAQHRCGALLPPAREA